MRRGRLRSRWPLWPIAVTMALAACGPTSVTSEPQLQAVDVAVRIAATGCGPRASLGGGAVVGQDRVATVAHVVAGADEIDVRFPDGRTVPADVVAIDRDVDLAILAVATATTPVLPLRRLPVGASGDVVVYRDDEPVVTSFTTLRYVEIIADDIDGADRVARDGFEIEADIKPGDSGTVLVADGVGTGVVFARSLHRLKRAWAADIALVRPLLDVATDGEPVDVGDCTP